MTPGNAAPASPGKANQPKPDPLRQVRDSARALLAQGKPEEAFEVFTSALAAVLNRNRELELLVEKLRRERFSSKSEQMDPAQLLLLFEELLKQQASEDTPIDAEAEANEDTQLDREIEDAEKAQTEGKKKKRKKRKRKSGPGWNTKGVEHQVHQVDLPVSEQTCTCGRQMKSIGWDQTRRLEFIPGHFIEHEHNLAKYACGKCKEGIVTAPAPLTILNRSAADASLLAHIVVGKFADHTPLHRLSRIYARSGAEIPVSTLSDWVAGVGNLVLPVVDALALRVLKAYIVRTDATGLLVLAPDLANHVRRGSIWAYVGDDRDVLFRYTPTGEGAAGPWKFLAGRIGFVQADASNTFDRLFNGKVAQAIEVGCWAHARRRLIALKDIDCRVAYPITLIARMYRIEHLADARELEPQARAALRQERTKPILDKLQRWYVSTSQSEPPSSDLAKAATYPVNHWEALGRFVSDGRLSLDNNLCESQLRDVALGRKNYLFAGSDDAASRAAALYSLTRTCAQYGVPPLAYFTDLLPKLAGGWDPDRLDELLPHRWAASTVDKAGESP